MIFPDEVWVIILQYLDLQTCISFSLCSKTSYRISDNQDVWKNYVVYPHLYRNDLDLYRYSWKHLVLDRNKKKTRCFVLDHVLYLDDNADVLLTTSEIKCKGFSFSMMIYPSGNPYFCDTQNNPFLSIYLKYKPSSFHQTCTCQFYIQIKTKYLKKRWYSDSIEFNPSLTNWGCHHMLSHTQFKKKSKMKLTDPIHISIFGVVPTFLLQIISTDNLFSHNGMNLSGLNTGYFIEEPFNSSLKDLRNKIAPHPNQQLWLFEVSPPYEYTPLYLLESSDDMKSLADVLLPRQIHLYRIWVHNDDYGTPEHIPYFIKRGGRLSSYLMMPPTSTKSDIEHIIGCPLYTEQDNTFTPHIFTTDVTTVSSIQLSYNPKNIVSDLYTLCHDLERLGLSPSRVINIFLDKNMKNVNQLFMFFTKKRHSGYCCDRCGKDNFEGFRYKCTVCDDYDLCHYCFLHQSDQTTHRYLSIINGKWVRKHYHSIHYKSHVVIRMDPCNSIILSRNIKRTLLR